MTTIYALECPVDGLIKYIGQSINPKDRLKQHCNNNENKDKWEWVCRLKDVGLEPSMIILDEVDSESNFWEMHYIFLYKSWGFTLYNKRLKYSKDKRKKEASGIKKVTITLTEEQQEKARKASVKLLGKENTSGYIGYLIEKERK